MPKKKRAEPQEAEAQDAPSGAIRYRTYEREVYSRLEGSEFEAVSRSMLAAMKERDEMRENKKLVAKEWAAQLEAQDAQIQAFRDELGRGKRETVMVEERRDLDAGRLVITRKDTLEVVVDRELTAEEQQLDLDGLDIPPADDAEAVSPHRIEATDEASQAEPEESDSRRLPARRLPVE